MKYDEYEMPDDYKRSLKQYTEMLNEREHFAKIIPTLPDKERREAVPILKEFDKNLDTVEQSLAEQFEQFQAQERNIDEKREDLWESMERIFIVAKHRFSKDEFEAYEKKTTSKMNPEIKREFYERIAIRESYDLHNILADLRPKDGSRYKPPMKHPFQQMKEACYEINRLAYETPEDFKKPLAEFEKIVAIRQGMFNRIKYAAPSRRGRLRQSVAKLDHIIEAARLKLAEFLEICLNEDGIVEIENPDQKKLDAAFAQVNIASERIFILTKHVAPHLLEQLTEIDLSIYDTPEEIAEFYERIAKREEEELDEILRSSKQNF